MGVGGFPDAVTHVVGAGQDERRPLGHHVVHDLGNGDARPIGGVHLVQTTHLGPGEFGLDVFPPLILGLTVPLVVLRTDKEQPEDEGFSRGRGRSGEKAQAEQQTQHERDAAHGDLLALETGWANIGQSLASRQGRARAGRSVRSSAR